MFDIVGIGANVVDTLVSLEKYPDEDTKMRAQSFTQVGGGPCATGLVAASKLGKKCAYIGNFADDSGGSFLIKDFKEYGVDTESCKTLSGYRSFSSQIWLSKLSTSRTIVFDKGNLPKLVLSDEQRKMIANAKVLMVDGNELEAAIEATKIAKGNNTLVLYDAGGLYEGVEKLLSLVDILIPSFEFAVAHTGCKEPQDAVKKIFEMYLPQVAVVTCGKDGGYLYDGKQVISYPIYPADVVDSNGAGDVFHGAFAAAICYNMDYETACHFSSAVSALKCKGFGARKSVPKFEQVISYLKENNFDGGNINEF